MAEAIATAPGEPEPAAGEITKEQLSRWSQIYETKERQLRRWVVRGRECKDPCPLDTPLAMPDWWAKHFTWSVPDKILRAARTGGDVKTGEIFSITPNAAGAQNATGGGAELAAPIDITSFNLDEGQAVQQQRQIVAALFSELQKAYLAGQPTEMLQSRYNKAAASLRILEKDDREAGVHRGKYKLVEEVEREWVTFAEMLRQMRDSMRRRVLEICQSLTPPQREEVGAAVDQVRAQEDRILQRLDKFESDDELIAELALL